MREDIQVPEGYVLLEQVDLHSNLALRHNQGVREGIVIGLRRSRGFAGVMAFLGFMAGLVLGAWLMP